MIAIRRYLVLFFFLAVYMTSYSQGVSIADTVSVPYGYTPKLERRSKHDAIDREQQSILSSDGKADKLFAPTNNDDINYLITKSVVKKVDNIQYLIETDKVFDHRLKVNYLHGLESVLKYFRLNLKQPLDKRVNPVH